MVCVIPPLNHRTAGDREAAGRGGRMKARGKRTAREE